MALELDMTEGIYRRIYAGFLTGKRINAVSLEAEAWFWRLHALADDYGNLHGSIRMLANLAAPRRDLPTAKVEALCRELEKAQLIAAYEVDGEAYFNIIGFEKKQPAGRNGRRIRKVPGSLGNPGESGIIRGSRSQSVSAHSDSDSDSDSHSEIKTDAPATPDAPTTLPKASRIRGPEAVPVPLAIDTERFRAKWAEWCEYRQAKKKPVSGHAAGATLSKLAKFGEATAIKAIEASIENDWQGVFPEKVQAAPVPKWKQDQEPVKYQYHPDGTPVNPVRAVSARFEHP